jgi:hypothetical protein
MAKGKTMDTCHNTGVIIERLNNGACVMKRICKQCQKEFIGERNLCPSCCNQRRRREGKFGPGYHRHYYRRKISILHDKGLLSRKRDISAARKAAFRKQRNRIREEMAAIQKAGYDPENDSIFVIERAGCLVDT